MPVLAEDEAEDQTEPERVHRDPDQDERRHGEVEQRARPQRREEAERKRDPEPDDEPAEDERQRHGRGVAEAGRHGLTVRVGAAEVAVAHSVPDEDGVLVRERAVDAVGRRESRPLLVLREHIEEPFMLLREMGLPTVGLIRCLLSFNLGVECGQLVIATCLLPLAYALNHWKHGRVVAMCISILLALFGTAWFIDRAFALELMQRIGL